MHVYKTFRRSTKWLLLIVVAALVGWASSGHPGLAQITRLGSYGKLLHTTLKTPGQARADRKNHQTKAAKETAKKKESEELRAELRSLVPNKGQALSPAAILVPEVEPNDTTAQAMQLDLTTSTAIVLGSVVPAGDRDFFKFNAPAGAKVWAYVDTGGTVNTGATSRDSLLTLFGTDGTTILEEDDDDGTGNGCDGSQETFLASAIAGSTLTTAGTYYLRVQQSNDNGVISPYTLYLVLTTTPPTAEVEPNNTTAQATPIITAGQTIGIRSGAISPAGDTDVYSVVANANDILYISTDDDPERDNNSNDSFIELISPTGSVVLQIDNSDDEGFPAPPAEAACFAVSTAGTYFVRIQHYSPSGTGTYHLMVAVAGQRQTDCPAVASLNPTSGAPGTSVTITGTNLTGVSAVTFPNNVTAMFTVVNATTVTTIVPAGAVSGQIQLSKSNCPVAVTSFFTVPGTLCPTITGINPATGLSGQQVVINGSNFIGVNAVRFTNNVAATFAVISNTLILATVPTGAVTGPITIVRPDCSAVQTTDFTINSGQVLQLAIDDGTFETSIGANGGGTDYEVNRLTPGSYPATLSRVSVFFPSDAGVQIGQSVRILVGTNPTGSTNIDNTPFQVTQATIQTLNQFNVFNVPSVTINSGDFVAGFSLTYASGAFPIAVDRTPPSQLRSYISANGTAFTLLDLISSGAFAGNFGIRAHLVGTLSNVSAASFLGTELARDSIVAVFGASLATTTQVATSTPLPTALAGTTVKVRDSAGTERLAPLFFVAPAQINYLMPAGTTTGTATITITSGDGSISAGTIQIAATAPGLFSANASGTGVAAAVVLRRNAAGQDTFEAVSRVESGNIVPVPIDLGAATDQVFPILYGTGIRGRSALSAVTARVGDVSVPVLFADDQGQFAGVDQINIGPLPRSLAGRGVVNVVLTVDGKTTNTVTVSIR